MNDIISFEQLGPDLPLIQEIYCYLSELASASVSIVLPSYLLLRLNVSKTNITVNKCQLACYLSEVRKVHLEMFALFILL